MEPSVESIGDTEPRQTLLRVEDLLQPAAPNGNNAPEACAKDICSASPTPQVVRATDGVEKKFTA
jgi:hypothetical protein